MQVKLDQITYEGQLDEDPYITSSISDIGLLHAITIREGKTVGNYDLIAGKKRLAAYKILCRDFIEAFVFPSDTPIDKCKEISLQENLRRTNLPWYDIIEQERDLHDLRIKQHGQAKSGGQSNGIKKGWSLRDTAKELGVALGVLSEDLNLADAVRFNPSLKNVKDKSTALRLIRLQAKTQLAEAEASIPSNTQMNQVLLGDSNDILKHFPANTFDLCITDPPWAEYADKSLTQDESTLPVFKELFRVLKADSFLYCILSTTDFPVYFRFLSDIGFTVQKYPMIWKKNGTITHGRRAWEYARDFELILLAIKGSPTLVTLQEMSSIIETGTLHHTAMIHPNEKPVELIRQLLFACSYNGSKVIDPFAGSGVVGEACKKHGREYIMIERNQKFYQNIVRRMEKLDV